MDEGRPAPQPFRFSDPRQQRIYNDLREVVSPGLAAFFRDACRLMANPAQLHSTAHLVAHLLREIENGLRDVFLPVVGRRGSQKGKDEHKDQIRLVLQWIGIPEDAPEAHAWFEFAKKRHSVAHRRGIDAPRTIAEISDVWEQGQVLLDVLLRALRDRFLKWLEVLDELLAKPEPTKDDVARLAHAIPNNAVTRGDFFDRLQHPGWIEPLRRKGFFRHPPEPIGDGEGGIARFPAWPEARYLARMAAHRPELVAQIMAEMDDTENAAVISDLVEALLAMPPEVSARLVEKAARWAESPYMLLPKKLGQLLSHWAKGDMTEEAYRVARVLLDVLPERRRIQPGPEESYHVPPEPRARFDVWDYQRILEKHYPDLVRQVGLPALELLCEFLDKAIRLSRSRDDDDGPEDYSCIWRPAVEDDYQNFGNTIKDALLSAVRDAAELLVRSGRGTVEEVVNALERNPWRVFRRIALHVLRVFPDQAETLAAARLTDRALFEDAGLQHEYMLLLRDRFPRPHRRLRRESSGGSRMVLKLKNGSDGERGRRVRRPRRRRSRATARSGSGTGWRD